MTSRGRGRKGGKRGAATNWRPVPVSVGPPSLASSSSTSEIKKSVALEVKDVPPLSKVCVNYMIHQLGDYFSTEKGKAMWGKIYTLLKFYCREPADFVMIEDFSGLFSCHFGSPLMYEKGEFRVHQNMLFACLQEWVDTWFDPLGLMRMRLRMLPKNPNKMKLFTFLDTTLSKSAKKNVPYAFDTEIHSDSEDEDEDYDFGFTISNPDRTLFNDLPSSELADKYRRVKEARRRLFVLLLYHFPVDGISMKQLPVALNQGVGGFSTEGSIYTEKNIKKYMKDIIQFKEIGRMWRVIRIKMASPDVTIEPRVLEELKITKQYNAAKEIQVENKPPDVKEEEKSENVEISEPERLSGVCQWFNVKKGFGFVSSSADGMEYFVHGTAISANNPDISVPSLADGEMVEFELIHGEKGLEASNVTGPNGRAVLGHILARPSFVAPPVRGHHSSRAKRRGAFLLPSARNLPSSSYDSAAPVPSVSPLSQGYCSQESPSPQPPENVNEHKEESTENDVDDDFSETLNLELEHHLACVAAAMDRYYEMEENLQNFVQVLVNNVDGTISWNQLKHVPGFEDKEKRKVVQKGLKGYGDIIDIRWDDSIKEMMVQLKDVSLFSQLKTQN